MARGLRHRNGCIGREGWKEASRGIALFPSHKGWAMWRALKEAKERRSWVCYAVVCALSMPDPTLCQKVQKGLHLGGCYGERIVGWWVQVVWTRSQYLVSCLWIELTDWLHNWGQVRESETLSRLQWSLSSQGAAQTRMSETVSWLWGQRVLENWKWKWKMEVCSELHSSDKTLLSDCRNE